MKHIIFPKDLNVWEKIIIQKNKFNVTNFDIPVEEEAHTMMVFTVSSKLSHACFMVFSKDLSHLCTVNPTAVFTRAAV